MSTVKFDTWQNTDGTENYKCRAWVNFNGTGTVAIRASGNVSSITDLGTGNYTVNFTTAMPDANYATKGSLFATTSSATSYIVECGNGTITGVPVVGKSVNASSTGSYDSAYFSVAVFR